VSRLTDLLEQLGIDIDPQLMDLAFTHRSWAYENGRVATNERLEFLGDSVLGVIVTEHIYHVYSDRTEGQLAKLRSAVVSGQTLAQVARELGVGSDVKLGKGEIATHGEAKDSILADTLEAIIGAIHLTVGFDGAGAVVHSLLDPIIAQASQLGAALDWKSSLQELMASMDLGAPEYSCVASGPDHERTFAAEVRVAEQVVGTGIASSRRGAEQKAAEMAYGILLPAAGE
jgi:ribonuclease-3